MTLLLEVETLLEETIDSVVTDEAVLKQHRTVLLKKLVEALESDPSWVEMYTVLGELHVPTISQDGEAGELLAMLIPVSCPRKGSRLSVLTWDCCRCSAIAPPSV
jgi:hypothetical protein